MALHANKGKIYFRTPSSFHIYLIFFTLALAAHTITSSGDTSQCLDWGFTENLECPTCDKIGVVLHDEEITRNCEECCKVPEVAAEIKYDKAVLEVGRSVLPLFPEVEGFYKNRRKQFSKLQTKLTRLAMRPVIHLYRDKHDEEPAESMGVSRWKEDSIVEFLDEKLQA
uniref:Selenoprotein F n=1 Tax=Fibrocapsa japonica TaxID=94617 RepID=A0A7S2UUQ0_9STRA|mmetsp:Transcript_14322/g.21063  ORF Transcript_14322/g.21063 Transcript_14322/m.21063 type:complete len:169 (+) Transcript_14322:53-559(+)|eukprot:CAMPEP_0113939526 /NCGR_PEP_ID=MMETSP1339-20121228/5818_1 /TAXON_ID=94617 /ORGANISM="Fibrocapsa japonica" /LENGTH=168 /DNA_ID=CAMNT_0000943043 /DNA_START=50 /DNA_END=556 /DNA_ORIENTATION=- /assembly_acc=CAM_ASM_000762